MQQVAAESLQKKKELTMIKNKTLEDIEFNSMNTANLAFIEEVNVFEHVGGARIIENNLYGQDRSAL